MEQQNGLSRNETSVHVRFKIILPKIDVRRPEFRGI